MNVAYQEIIRIVLLFNSNLNVAQNGINVQGELANKIDYRTVSYKHRTGRILVQLYNGACTIIPHPTVEVKHI